MSPERASTPHPGTPLGSQHQTRFPSGSHCDQTPPAQSHPMLFPQSSQISWRFYDYVFPRWNKQELVQAMCISWSGKILFNSLSLGQFSIYRITLSFKGNLICLEESLVSLCLRTLRHDLLWSRIPSRIGLLQTPEPWITFTGGAQGSECISRYLWGSPTKEAFALRQ